MNKIICSVEEWDSIFDYYRPNGSSKTWYLKELKRLSIPLMWGEWNIFNERGEIFDKDFFKQAITPSHSTYIEYKTANQIGDTPHIYIINVYSNDFFYKNYDIGFSCISKNYLDDVRNSKSKILIFFIYEGYSGTKNNNHFETIEKWRIDSDLPINSVYYVCGNLMSNKIVESRNLGFRAKGIHYFEPWNRYDDDLVKFTPSEDKYLFLSYNRHPRLHRIKFANELIKEDLINDGLMSLNKLNEVPNWAEQKSIDFFTNNLPMTIDSLPELKYNLACNITKVDYERTFISIVTETLTTEGTLFFSEKIWKPIMVGHPFIIFGNQNSLKYLKSLGYKTFDKWIDESYDDEVDEDVRCRLIVNEIKKLKSKSKDELSRIREEMMDTCVHNSENYKKLYKKNYRYGDQSETIKEVLFEIWEEITGQPIERDLI